MGHGKQEGIWIVQYNTVQYSNGCSGGQHRADRVSFLMAKGNLGLFPYIHLDAPQSLVQGALYHNLVLWVPCGGTLHHDLAL